MFEKLGADVQRLRPHVPVIRLIFMPTIWVIVWYRFGYWSYHNGMPKLLALPFRLLHWLGNLIFEVTLQMSVSPQAEIGPGLKFAHTGNIYIHPEVVMGDHCSIAHEVTIGTSAQGRPGAPRLGDDVYVGAGAKVIGKIKIGEGAKIAANSLVITNVPAGATVMGVPARVTMRAPKPAPKAEQKTEGSEA